MIQITCRQLCPGRKLQGSRGVLPCCIGVQPCDMLQLAAQGVWLQLRHGRGRCGRQRAQSPLLCEGRPEQIRSNYGRAGMELSNMPSTVLLLVDAVQVTGQSPGSCQKWMVGVAGGGEEQKAAVTAGRFCSPRRSSFQQV